jgi:lysophospholipase L1-like esterase
MRYGPCIYALYLLTVVVIILVLIEYIALRINKRDGEDIPFLYNEIPSIMPEKHSNFSILDPNLGYTHGDAEIKVKKLKTRFSWLKSFAIYSNTPISLLDRPIILTLGGSTTDPVQYGHSWPEELATLLSQRHVRATVINGAVGGYSSNQELIKLIRDGLEFHPDIIISYGGVNDRGKWGEFPNPMVHTYQRRLLELLLMHNYSPLFPNAMRVIEKYLFRQEQKQRHAIEGYTLGLDTSKTPGQWYERNLALMHAVSEAEGAKFFGVIQPNAFVGDYDLSEFDRSVLKGKGYQKQIQQLYSEISTLPQRVNYIRDFTAIFDGIGGVYTDGVHTTTKGEKIIAEHMFALITTSSPP